MPTRPQPPAVPEPTDRSGEAPAAAPPIVRPFRHDDREQLTELVNAHVGAVVPNVVLPVQAVLAALERQPGEFIVDPWVRERVTLVAEQRGRVVAVAHLLRYADGSEVGPAYRDAGEIDWLLFWPAASFWPDPEPAARMLLDTCVSVLRRWRVRRAGVDGAPAAPGVFGVPDQWPHITALYREAGFTPADRAEQVWIADLDRAWTTPAARSADGRQRVPALDVRITRRLGEAGTRFDALGPDGARLGFIEVDAAIGAGVRHSQLDGWADIGNLHVHPDVRRHGVGSRLLTEAVTWLRLGGVRRLLAYTIEDGSPAESEVMSEAESESAFLRARGFTVLTRTVRGWDLEL